MRIHIVSNSLYVNSGFGKVTRYIALGLKELGHSVLATGLQTAQKADYYYGIETLPIDSGGHIDETGQLLLNIQHTNPDVLLYVGQMDADLNFITKLFNKTLAYVPVEGRNIPTQMMNDLLYIEKNGGTVISQCYYGQSEMKKVGVDAKTIYHGYDPSIFYNMEKFGPYCYYRTSVGQINTDPLWLCKNGCYDCKQKGKIDCPNFKEETVSILMWDNDNARWYQRDIGIGKLNEEFKGRFLYLFVGQNFGLRKRIERLLRSYSILIGENRQLRDRTHIHLHTLPISVRGINLIKVVDDLGIKNNVSFSYGAFRSSGWSEEALNILYNLADCNVSASSSEGFGLGTLESMACGKPNIGPNCSSFTELIGEDPKTRRGLLSSIIDWQMIPDGSIRALVSEEDLAHQMKTIYQNEELRKTLSKNAIRFSQNYTWEKIVIQWDQLLKTIK